MVKLYYFLSCPPPPKFMRDVKGKRSIVDYVFTAVGLSAPKVDTEFQYFDYGHAQRKHRFDFCRSDVTSGYRIF